MQQQLPGQEEDFEIKFPHANIKAARALGGILRKTLGPQTQDVMILNDLESNIEGDLFSPIDDDITVTNDGATILEKLPLEHPIAPVLKRLSGPKIPGESDVEGEQITDGISTAVTLTESLLIEAEALIDQGVHPRTIQVGYAVAKQAALNHLTEWSESRSETQAHRADLLSVARTAMTGNDIGGNLDQWAEYAADASALIGAPTPETFVVRRINDGTLANSRLVRGAVLDRSKPAHDEMPTQIEDANIAVFTGTKEGGLRTPDISNNWTASVDSPIDVAQYSQSEQDNRERIVDKLLAYNVDVVVTQQGIDTEYQRLLADNDILGIRGVNTLDLDQLCCATGATGVLKTEDFTAADLGHAGNVSVEQIEPRENRRKRRRMVVFDECENPGAVTMLIRGTDSNIGRQASTSIRKAVAATAAARGMGDHPSGVLPGGANPEIRVANELRDLSLTRENHVQLAIDGYANAVERVAKTLVENAGLDPFMVLPNLKAQISSDDSSAGIALPAGEITSMRSAGILDALSHRQWAYTAATEVASQIITIDDAIDAEFTEDEPDPDDAIYDEVAERHAEHHKKNSD